MQCGVSVLKLTLRRSRNDPSGAKKVCGADWISQGESSRASLRILLGMLVLGIIRRGRVNCEQTGLFWIREDNADLFHEDVPSPPRMIFRRGVMKETRWLFPV